MTDLNEQPGSRYRRVESIYQRALDVPDVRRDKFLSDECGTDQALLQEVEQLLNHFKAAKDTFLNRPAHGLGARWIDEDVAPAQIGRYVIRGKLGEGGMGVVYRAEQKSPRRDVALKVIRAGVVGRRLLRRFDLEATVLGRLKHPGIAQIYEAGTYDDGTHKRPYFAMELVDGPPLNSFVTEKALNIRDRLQLFLKICDAVNHAHQKGVIHRDLKPANILVAVTSTHSSVKTPVAGSTSVAWKYDVDGDPKILDFGVARATDLDIQATTLHTDMRLVVGTLPYMSPEQVEGHAHQLDVRSDVYALGVIFYELFAGRVPFELKGKTVAAAARVICDTEPTRLGVINSAYRGDISTIASKALEKNADRRYQSVADFAADVRRHLNDEPIAARPASTFYQLRKFVRRNRGFAAGVSAAFVVLVVGVVVSVSFAVQRSSALDEANRQRDIAIALSAGRAKALEEARRQRDIAQTVNEFLERDLLANANPSNEPDRSISLREVVDRASERIGNRFQDIPLVEAALRTTLANTYKELGEYTVASGHAKTALSLLESVHERPINEWLQTMNRVATLEKLQGRRTQAEALYRRALATAEETLGPEHESTMSIVNNLALLLERRQAYAEAASLLEPLLERRTRLLGESHQHTMITMNNLALLYLSMERYDDAERLHIRELALSKRVMGPEHPDTLISIKNLAVLHARRGDFLESERLMRDALHVESRVLGANHPRTLATMEALAAALSGLERFEEAELTLLDALARCDDTLGPEHPQALHSRTQLANLYLNMGRLDEAEAIARENYYTRHQVLGADHGGTGVILGVLSRICFERGKLQEAATLGRRGYSILKNSFGPKHSKSRKVARELSDVYSRLGKNDQAQYWRTLGEG